MVGGIPAGGDRAPGAGGRDGIKNRTQLLIFTVYGRYSPVLDHWAGIGHLVEMMRHLGVEAPATRSAVARLVRGGFLVGETRGGVRGYAATQQAQAIFAEGDAIIYSSMEPSSLADGWTIVSYSVPESRREDRYQLRRRLEWLGMGNLGGGLWIGPARVASGLMAWMRKLGFEGYVDVFSARYEGFASLEELVRRCWDLTSLGTAYDTYVAEWGPQLRRLRRRTTGPDPAEAFRLYTTALEERLRFPYLDPRLPAEMLPPSWSGERAHALFNDLRDRLEEPAFAFVRALVRPAGDADRAQ